MVLKKLKESVNRATGCACNRLRCQDHNCSVSRRVVVVAHERGGRWLSEQPSNHHSLKLVGIPEDHVPVYEDVWIEKGEVRSSLLFLMGVPDA